MKVIKRDGTKQEFDPNKIKKAIQGAWEDILEEGVCIKDEVLDDLTNRVIEQLDKRKNHNVEEINDLVELTLMKECKFDVAKQFIEYRQLHKMVRNKYQEFMDEISTKLKATDIENQNANLDENSLNFLMYSVVNSSESVPLVTKDKEIMFTESSV